ncbi:MAG: DEAD/DEAH box helicase, partial [Kiritimatiellales bacterium]|nr:DEAD/DEAH box helicase [Kiritimatiellales bacterium]
MESSPKFHIDAPLTAQALACIGLFEKDQRNVLWIANDVREMEKLHESVCTLVSNDWKDSVRIFQPLEKDPAVLGEHLQLAEHVSQNKPFVIVTCFQALETEVPLAGKIDRSVRTLKTGEEHKLSELTEWMSAAGYEFGIEVYQQGEAALRGGILDCWPPGLPRPVRIEFFGDEIDSIRYFDDQTQCSVEKTDTVKLSPMDFAFAGEETCRLGELLPENTLTIGEDEIPESTFDFFDTGLFAVSFDVHPKEAEEARRGFVSNLCKKSSRGWKISFYFETGGTLARFKELYSGTEGFQSLELHRGVLHDSAIDHQHKILIIAECDFYAYHINRSAHARTAKRFQRQERVSEAADIQPGDYVVHFEHGVGKYLGIIEIDFSGRRQEVLAIEYAKGAKVYLPVTQAHLLTRYKGMGKTTPKPHRLGGKKWKEDKADAAEAIQDFAASLLETQALRQAKKGHRFSKDTPWQAEFESSFPYTETPDQLTAADEIKHEMEKSRPVDRLLCGDVGFGKTEVAMRAAFKAVMDGMQVAILVPTTILAQQHYETFIERMAAFPVRIDMVSRFRTRAEQNKTIFQALEGDVDILIGTHRILSKDVNFKNLGLVIIDEEQRFGVKAKEHLKELRTQVDVITMS